MKVYHFSCGDSTDGAVGFCCDVRAKSKADAVKKLNKLVDDFSLSVTEHIDPGNDVWHATVYFGKVTKADIEDIYEESDL